MATTESILNLFFEVSTFLPVVSVSCACIATENSRIHNIKNTSCFTYNYLAAKIIAADENVKSN